MTDTAEIFKDCSAEQWAMWKNSPMTAAFMGFVTDCIVQERAAAAEALESGKLSDQASNPANNTHYRRGRIHALRELQALKLEEIQEFYEANRQ